MIVDNVLHICCPLEFAENKGERQNACARKTCMQRMARDIEDTHKNNFNGQFSNSLDHRLQSKKKQELAPVCRQQYLLAGRRVVLFVLQLCCEYFIDDLLNCLPTELEVRLHLVCVKKRRGSAVVAILRE